MPEYVMPDSPEYQEVPKEPTSQRRSTAAMELQSFFATMPHPDALNGTVGDGAALMHKHMGFHPVLRANTLYTSVSAIMNTTQSRAQKRSTMAGELVTKDAMVKRLHEHVTENTSGLDKLWLDTLSTSAITRTVRERVVAGKHGKEDLEMLDWLFMKVHGQEPAKRAHVRAN